MARTRIVLDVNVYVSGLLWTGTPHQILQAAEAETLTLVTAPMILEELREVLSRPKFSRRIAALSTSVGELIGSLLTVVEIIQNPSVKPVIQQDPDDDKILACAFAVRAQWIVSGDDHLLSLKRYQRIRIVTLREFWDAWVRP